LLNSDSSGNAEAAACTSLSPICISLAAFKAASVSSSLLTSEKEEATHPSPSSDIASRSESTGGTGVIKPNNSPESVKAASSFKAASLANMSWLGDVTEGAPPPPSLEEVVANDTDTKEGSSGKSSDPLAHKKFATHAVVVKNKTKKVFFRSIDI